MENIFSQIINSVTGNFPTIIFVIALAYLGGLVNSIQAENEDKTELVSLAIICIGTAPLIEKLSKVITNTKDTVSEVQATMTSVVPSLAAMNLNGDNVSGISFFYLQR